MPRLPSPETVVPWMLRVSWIAVFIAGGGALDDARAGRGEAVEQVVRWAPALVWVVGAVAMTVPATVSLTLTRVLVPLAVPTAILAWWAGADSVRAAIFVSLGVFTALLATNGDLGRSFVQASAYGEEDRFPLRPPPSYTLAAAVAWSICASALFSGLFLLADGRWWGGAPLAVIAVAGAIWAWPRWHRLSRRWLVIVPAGIVVHDDLVLAETLMLRRSQMRAVHLARAGTEAADLTGPAGGHAIEIVTSESVTAIFAPTPREPRGTAIHLTGCLVAPTRPGRALAAAAARRFPVG